MRVVLMAAGHIGHTIASFLSGCGDYQVRVVDRSADALKTLSRPLFAMMEFALCWFSPPVASREIYPRT